MWFKLLLISLGSASLVSSATNAIVCYHGAWSTYRAGNGHFGVADIDPTLCTHLIYSFVGIDAPTGAIRHLEPALDTNGNIRQFTALKQLNPSVKTLVAIGGWNEASTGFSAVSKTPASRSNFVRNTLAFVQKWGFDGVDIDWEYPATRGGLADDKANFGLLLQEFRGEWSKHGLLLTAAVSATPDSVDGSYDVPALSENLDLINVMAYDLHGSWDGVTGQNAPLYAADGESWWQKQQLNVDASIRHWIRRGADPQKITLGLGMYGRSYTLVNPDVNGLGAPVLGPGAMGPYTAQAGMLGYNEIAEMLAEECWTTVWDDVQKTPYSYKGSQWIGYDNERSIQVKMDYAKSLNLAGAMIWSIETDDFRGASGTKFALLRAINAAISGDNNNNGTVVEPSEPVEVQPAEPSVPEVVVPEPVQPVVPVITPTNVCRKVGYVRNPEECSKFIYCMQFADGFLPLSFACNAGLYYDEERLLCDWPQNVKC